MGLPEYVQWKLKNIYQDMSETAKAAAESRYDGVGSSEADAFFRSYGDAANLYLPSLAARFSGGDAAYNAKLGKLNQQRHPVISGVGEALGWMSPGLSNVVGGAVAGSGLMGKAASAAERGIAGSIGKLAGKSGIAAAHPKLVAAGANAIVGGGTGTLYGALQSAADGNDAQTIIGDALRQGWNSAKYSAIGGGIRGGLQGWYYGNGMQNWGNAGIDPRLEAWNTRQGLAAAQDAPRSPAGLLQSEPQVRAVNRPSDVMEADAWAEAYWDEPVRYTAPKQQTPTYEPWMEAYRDDAGKFLLQDGVDGDIIGTTKNLNGQIPWDSWRNYDKVTDNGQLYANVGGRLYSKHAVERMQPSHLRYTDKNVAIKPYGGVEGRSVAPRFVEDVIRTTRPTIQENGNLSYRSGMLEVITNPQGNVITVMIKGMD